MALPSAAIAPFGRASSDARPRRAGTGWFRLALIAAGLVLLPVVALLVQAASGSSGLWPHLLANVLPQALRETAILLIGVGIVVTAIGTGTAWLVTAWDFPGRRWLAWALALPLAMPTYIIAYVYLDLMHPIGPVQTLIRDVLGYSSPREFRLPDIRSMTGGVILLGLVLYPYVYVPVRALFASQSATLIEASRMLGTGRASVFHRVALPLARPAIAVGASLAMMEALNDVGAVEFLGIRTLTVSIYSTWVTRSDLAGAAQIALAMLALILMLLAWERSARRNHRYAASAMRATPLRPRRLTGWSAGLALALGLIPVTLGFLLPGGYLVRMAWHRMADAPELSALFSALGHTLTLAAAATVVTLGLGLAVAVAGRMRPGRGSETIQRLSSIGYAMPGTVVALGLLMPVAMMDGVIDRAAKALTGHGVGLILLGSGAALVMAYAVRFLSISSGTAEAGFSRLSPSFDLAARSLGRSPGGVLREIHLPLLRGPLAAAALLVFVDCVKELPATLMLRPLGVETLATLLYGEAARGTYENGALAALAIVLAGLLPAALLTRIGDR